MSIQPLLQRNTLAPSDLCLRGNREQAEIHGVSLDLCKGFVYVVLVKILHKALQNHEVESLDVEVMKTCCVSERVSS